MQDAGPCLQFQHLCWDAMKYSQANLNMDGYFKVEEYYTFSRLVLNIILKCFDKKIPKLITIFN